MRDVGEGAMKGYPNMENRGYVVLDKAKLNTPDLVQYFKNEKNNKLDIKIDRELLQQYSRILAFRALFETSDANNHNFLIDIKKNKLYSIDENVVFKVSGLPNKEIIFLTFFNFFTVDFVSQNIEIIIRYYDF
jgi:hypothetical protein